MKVVIVLVNSIPHSGCYRMMIRRAIFASILGTRVRNGPPLACGQDILIAIVIISGGFTVYGGACDEATKNWVKFTPKNTA